MAERTIPCGPAPLVTVRGEKNLSIRGGNPAEIKITLEDLQGVTVVDQENGLKITCEEDCALSVPADARLTVEEAGGNASVYAFSGELQIHKVEGNLTLNRIGDAEIRRVDGNLRVDSAGKLTVKGLGGNLKGGQLSGPLAATAVGGNIKLAAAAGLDKARAGGNVRLGLTAIQNDMEITAGGNIRVHLPPSTPFVLDATSGGHEVTVDFGGSARKLSGSTVGIRFGAGGPRLKLTAGGSIILTDQGYEQGEGEEINVEFDWAEMNERIQRRIEEKARRAEERVEAARRRAERRVREAMEKLGGMGFSGMMDASLSRTDWQGMPAAGFQAEPFEESEPVTDAEKMLVLNMLQEKKITAEEAERLLDALAGKFD